MFKLNQPIKAFHLTSRKSITRYDKIHKVINISWHASIVIKHPIFARLKEIKQLGTLCFKFKYAEHTRFEHSIGVAYLARYTAQALRRKHLEINERHALCVELAGLCHDIGHGAYSHSYDHLLFNMDHIPATAHHEVRSMILFRIMIEEILEEHPEFLSEEEIRLVQYFIDPTKYKQEFSKDELTDEQKTDYKHHPNDVMPFMPGLEQIVNNQPRGVDVDRMDYLVRDALMMRFDQTLRTDLNIRGLLKRSMLLDGAWVFDVQNRDLVHDLIFTRHLFYTHRYVHPNVHAIDEMFTDALSYADHILNVTKPSLLATPEDVREFCALTDDHLIDLILNTDDDRLHEAKNLIERIIENREVYKHTGDFITNASGLMPETQKEIPFDVLGSSSEPTRLLPKVLYHNNGELVDPSQVKRVRRMYVRSPGRILSSQD